jgi:hypothetical protein
MKAFPLREFPEQFATQPLAVAYVTDANANDYVDFGAPQRIRGALGAG